MFVSPCLRRNRLAYGHASANQSQKQTRTCTSRMLRHCRFICPHYNLRSPQKPCTSRMLQHRHLLFTYTCAHTEGCANACSDAHAHIQNAHYWTCKLICAHTKCRATANDPFHARVSETSGEMKQTKMSVFNCFYGHLGSCATGRAVALVDVQLFFQAHQQLRRCPFSPNFSKNGMLPSSFSPALAHMGDATPPDVHVHLRTYATLCHQTFECICADNECYATLFSRRCTRTRPYWQQSAGR